MHGFVDVRGLGIGSLQSLGSTRAVLGSVDTAQNASPKKCVTYDSYSRCLTHKLDACIDVGSEVGLGIIWDTPYLPWNPVSEGGEIWSGQEPLIVVPVSNDVYGTGEDDHPGYGLVEGEVLVQETFDGARWALH